VSGVRPDACSSTDKIQPLSVAFASRYTCVTARSQVRDKGRKRGDDVLRVSGYANCVESRAVILGKLRGVVRGKIERTIIHIPGDERNGAAIGLHESGNVVNFWYGFGTVSDALRVCEMHVSSLWRASRRREALTIR